MRSILITGANGFVGSYLERRGSARNEIIATGSGAARIAFGPDTVYESTDITDPSAVKDLLARHQPAVIVHAAAISQPDLCEKDPALADRVNIDGTRNLLEAVAGSDAHFIFLSTDFVFDGKRGLYREEDPVGPVNYYGETKLAAERLVRQYPGLWSIARTVLVYGDPCGARGNLLTMVAGALREGRALRIFNDQLRTPTFVEDLADGILAIIDRRAGGTWHLSGEDVRTPYEMAMETAQLLELDASLITPITGRDMKELARRPQKTGFDISKAKKELAYAPTSFAEGLARTFCMEKER
ncbi:SDR family oxidoreductase [Flaviaesturariibacter flavus]|uniref:dTDP-4-dehydrorhamnose reductase n=1 Tax=Flaviaesturariibacter flavus TaxID=2502780 RepID=A0A4R1BNM2_9BACT|nr:SDR family oxidoreductase [Flaviaesturariibacter flavus]TCJ19149.1 SDR family oxidoreductase [Flaviaesturariibacter flavus]